MGKLSDLVRQVKTELTDAVTQTLNDSTDKGMYKEGSNTNYGGMIVDQIKGSLDATVREVKTGETEKVFHEDSTQSVQLTGHTDYNAISAAQIVGETSVDGDTETGSIPVGIPEENDTVSEIHVDLSKS